MLTHSLQVGNWNAAGMAAFALILWLREV